MSAQNPHGCWAGAGVLPLGTAGTTGAEGTIGPPGATGVAGKTGAPGTIGPPGATGVAGKMGAPGTRGAAGTAGTAGKTGAPGTRGAAGTAGGAGKTGAPGTIGAAGTTGAAGITPAELRGALTAEPGAPLHIPVKPATIRERRSFIFIANRHWHFLKYHFCQQELLTTFGVWKKLSHRLRRHL